MSVTLPPTAEWNPALLVRGQCECGWLAALPEGSKWPACPECGAQVMPPKEDREAYVAIRMEEEAAVTIVVGGRPDYARLMSDMVRTASPLVDGRYGPSTMHEAKVTELRERFAGLCDKFSEIIRRGT